MNYIDIKKFREDYDLTQSELAEICGVSLRAVQSWEQNQRNITQSAIKLINIFKKENNIIKDEGLDITNDILKLKKDNKKTDYTIITENNMINDDPSDYKLQQKNEYYSGERESLIESIKNMTETADRNSRTLEKIVDYLINDKKKGDDIVQRNGNDDAARDA